MCVLEMFVLKKVWKKSLAALHRLTQDVQCSTRYPKTHVGGPDLDLKNPLRKLKNKIVSILQN